MTLRPIRRIIVCGGRDYSDRAAVRRALIRFASCSVTVVHGAGRGADALAAEVAAELGMQVQPYPAAWARYGRAAGPKRNQEMVADGADLLIAFPGGRGTRDMVKRATKASIPVEEL